MWLRLVGVYLQSCPYRCNFRDLFHYKVCMLDEYHCVTCHFEKMGREGAAETKFASAEAADAVKTQASSGTSLGFTWPILMR